MPGDVRQAVANASAIMIAGSTDGRRAKHAAEVVERSETIVAASGRDANAFTLQEA